MTEQQAEYDTEKDKTIFRVEKNKDNPFVMIDRRPIENPALSWKAKGLLAYLISRPDDWVIRFKDLVKRSPDGGHTVRAAMKELKAAGHVLVFAEREGGRVKQWIYKVYELPPDVEFQQVEKQQVENRTFNNNKLTKKKKSTDIKEAKPREPKAYDFPSNVLFREVTGYYPNKANWHDVLKHVNDVEKRIGRPPVKDDLFPFFSAWTGLGRNPKNLDWMTFAVRGVLPSNVNGNSKQTSSLPQGMVAAQSWLQKKQAETYNG